MKRGIGWILLCSALLCFFSSCTKKAEKSPGEKIRIAVIPKGTTHEFWKSIHLGALQAAKEFDVEVIWKGPQKEDDRAQQITVVEDFISRAID